MKSLLIFLRITVIYILQLVGSLAIADGLRMIWPPLCPIYGGIVMLFVGHRLYLQLESEETEK